MGTHFYPMTKMNFLVTVGSDVGSAAFSEVTGIDSTVDVIEFRQGNAGSLAPIKIPGLVKHGNITLKYGLTKGGAFKEWVISCVNERRGKIDRQDVTVELIDITEGSPQSVVSSAAGATHMVWVFKNAWVAKYTGADLNSTTSEVAIETVEIAYEEILIPMEYGANTGGGGGGGGDAE
ncbi:MAG: phage tail protein [Oscillospiraceae bacterium]|nr:phage tail protein [Oscillospiraceae bacterium]